MAKRQNNNLGCFILIGVAILVLSRCGSDPKVENETQAPQTFMQDVPSDVATDPVEASSDADTSSESSPSELMEEEPRPARLLEQPRRASGPSCGSKRYCGDMNSCSEAMHYLNECGLSRLDRDSDGIPCESIC